MSGREHSLFLFIISAFRNMTNSRVFLKFGTHSSLAARFLERDKKMLITDPKNSKNRKLIMLELQRIKTKILNKSKLLLHKNRPSSISTKASSVMISRMVCSSLTKNLNTTLSNNTITTLSLNNNNNKINNNNTINTTHNILTKTNKNKLTIKSSKIKWILTSINLNKKIILMISSLIFLKI